MDIGGAPDASNPGLQPSAAGPWRRERIVDAVDGLLGPRGALSGRPFILAIDGRSSSGKTSLAARIHDTVAHSCVVHTDDLAWHHSRFGWDDLLIDRVLIPLRRGGDVRYRPPEWERKGRAGAIEVPAGVSLVVIDGVGAGRRELAQHIDALVWVHADGVDLEHREAVRVAQGEVNKSNQDQWQLEEVPFLADQRPWERATLIVAGTPNVPHDPETEIIVSDRSD